MSKNILITGSTDGIGKLAAIRLAKDGHQIYLHGRSAEKLSKVIEEVKSLAGREKVGGFIADFSDLDAVRNMGQEVYEKLDVLDVLINNAGVFKSANQFNKDGLDLRMAVNYLAPYVLTEALLPLLQKAINPRLINLSSAAQAPVSSDVLLGKRSASAQDTYAQSKLALTMWSFHLARKLQNVSVIPVNPGSLLNTRMVQEAYGRFWSSAEKGADILYDLAVSERYEGITGKYFDNDKGSFGDAHPDAYDEEAIQQLMTVTKDLLS